MDLKAKVAGEIILLLKPAREHFAQEEVDKKYREFVDLYEASKQKGLR